MQVQRSRLARLAALGITTACLAGVTAAPAPAAPAISELMIVKRVDAGTPTLMHDASTGAGDARPRRTSEGETPDYLVVKIEHALVMH